MQLSETLGLIQSIVTIFGVLLGSVWVFVKYILHKENSPRIEFFVDVQFIGKQEGMWLIEILGNLENKGQVPYHVTRLDFEAKYLLKDDTLDEEKKYHEQIDIKHLLKAQSWLPSNAMKPAILHPGIKMRYNYIYSITTSASFLLLHGVLDYGSGLQTRADRLIKVPE